MMKSIVARSTLPPLLLVLCLLLTACDQVSTPGPTAQALATQTTNTQTSSDPATATPVIDVPTGVISTEATATILVGQTGLDLTSVDPCKLLTQDDVKSAMGDVPYKPKPLSQDAYHTACSYVEPTLEVNSPRLFVSLDPIEVWDFHPSDAQTVSGIGDAAYNVDYSGWSTLSVLLRNRVIVAMDIYPPDLEKAKQLTAKAIERLP